MWSFVSDALNLTGTATGLFFHLTLLFAGLIALFFGQKLYWIAIGLGGFLGGLFIFPFLFPGLESGLAQTILIVALGILFAVFSVFFNRWMIIISAFFILAKIGLMIYGAFHLPMGLNPLVFFGSGLIGAWIAAKTLDEGLILFSSLIGALMINTSARGFIPLSDSFNWLLFLILLITGVVYQNKNLSDPELSTHEDTSEYESQITTTPKKRKKSRRKK